MMKLVVTINYGKVAQEITLPVGHGMQNFKWLASAAAYRFVHDGLRRGGRHLSKRDRHALPARTRLLPKDVRTEDCPFLHPYDVIQSHLADGSKVTVDLYDALPSDDFGIPVLSAWATIAFCHGERHREQRDSLIEQKKREVETFKQQRENEALITKMNIEKPKIALMKRVMVCQLQSGNFEGEWGIIKKSGILDNIVPSEEHQEQIHQFYSNYFVELNDMYKFYSAVNSGGGTHTLEYIELFKFVTETEILGEEHHNALQRIFVDSHIGRKTGMRPSIHSEIRRGEFFVALVKIAVLKNITIKRKAIVKLRKKGLQVSIAKAKLPTAPEALEMMYRDFLSPVLKEMPAGKVLKDAIGSDDVLIVFYDHLAALARCFEKYATESEGEGCGSGDSVPNGSMTLHEFGKFAIDVGLVDPVATVPQLSSHGRRRHSIVGHRSSSITQKNVRQIFSASQQGSDEVNATELKRVAATDNLSSHNELMMFSEFLEAVARLGVLKHHAHSSKQLPAAVMPSPPDTIPSEESEHMEVLSHCECIKLIVEHVSSSYCE